MPTPPAADRDPGLLCTARRTDGDPCGNYALRHLDVCRFHGGGSPASTSTRARGEIVQQANRHQLPLPKVETKDFPTIAAQLVALDVRLIAELEQELDTLRLLHSPIENARAYSDILDRLSRLHAGITKTMQAAAMLGVQVPGEAPPKPPPEILVAAALTGVRGRLLAQPGACPCCGQQKPVTGAVVDPPSDSPSDSEPEAQSPVDEPLAGVVAMAPPPGAEPA